MMQCIWNIKVRNQELFKRISNEILEGIDVDSSAKKWRPAPGNETDARWLKNGRNAEHILIGYSIQDENGTPFWVLLAQRFTFIKGESDWQCKQLHKFIEWMLSPEMILGLWVEVEAVQYFEASYSFHAKGGELCSRPGFRCLELFQFMTDHAFPWWEEARTNPESRFPRTFKWIKEEIEDKGKPDVAELKREQIAHGITCGYNEIANMYDEFMDAPFIFTAITFPVRGQIILLVILALVKSTGFDLDKVYDDEGDLIDEDLEWGWYHAPEAKPATYDVYYDKLKNSKADLVHWIQQLGFMKSKCRNDLKRLSQERGVIRDPASKTRLMTFAGCYTQVFDILWVEFAMCPSSTRMAEAFNGIERWCWDPQTTRDWRDARGRYLAKKENDNRRERRNAIYNSSMEKLKCAPKHNDRNLTVTLAGAQCNSNIGRYTRYELEKRTPESILIKYSSTAIIKRGTMVEQKEHVDKLVDHAENKRRRKESSDGYETYQDNLLVWPNSWQWIPRRTQTGNPSILEDD
jgi:hypothetical protein